jgi:hypothetical protein
MDRYLFHGLAKPRKVVEANVAGITDRVIEHFLKVFLFDDEQNRHHWYSELRAFIKPLLGLRVKPDNKPPIKIVEDNFIGSMENEWETEGWVDSVLEEYPRATLFDDLFDHGHLRCLFIQKRWVKLVNFICRKFREGDREISVMELEKIIGR